MEDAYIVVFTTVATEAQADALARSIVTAGLAACVQIESIRSVYRWKGEVCAEPEFRLTIKTAERQFPALERHIKASHTYETPEIVKVAIGGGSREYLAWIDECVTPG
ncbi:MAG TPA: divalent-cation tolerance protein CutA [Acidobacteriaceae bacterium]